VTDFACPNWRALVDERDRTADGEARWRLGIEHAAQCADCRERAVEVDPLAVFSISSTNLASEFAETSRTGAVESPKENEEVAEMLRAVSTLRRHHKPALTPTNESAKRHWVSWAAAALFLLSLTLLGPTTPEIGVHIGEDAVVVVDNVAESGETQSRETSEPATLGPITLGATVSLADDGLPGSSEPPAAPRIYRWHDRDLSVVMIVDETLDV